MSNRALSDDEKAERSASVQRALRERGQLDALKQLAMARGVTLLEMCGPCKAKHVIEARWAFWQYLHETIGWSGYAIAKVWGVDHTTVYNAIGRGFSQ